MSQESLHSPLLNAEQLKVHDKELAHLGALLTEAAMRSDLDQVVETHVQQTGRENPNSYDPNRLRVGEQTVPESSDNVYRMTDASGVEDLAAVGVVRGRYTAGVKGAKTASHTTYWNQGETGKGSTLGQGFVLEAPFESAASGWVKADKVNVYARDNDDIVKQINASRQ